VFCPRTLLWTIVVVLWYIKIHRSVLCGPRSRFATLWVYWQEERKCNHTYVALRSLTQIQPNFWQRCPPGRQVYIPNLKQITQLFSRYMHIKCCLKFFFFLIFNLFAHLETLTLAWIKLKFGTQNRHIKLNLRTNFGVNLMIKISGVMTNCLKSFHTYRVNHFKEWVETWHADGVTIVRVPIQTSKWIKNRHQRYESKPNRFKIKWSIFVNKNLLVFHRNRQTT